MRAWVIKTGEPIPHVPAEAQDRLFRAGLMAQALTDAGHDVTWWTGQFHHQQKTMRDVPASEPVVLAQNTPEMIFLPSSGYARNISFARFRDHAQQRRAFESLAPGQPRPDVIVCAWPTIDLAYAATEFGKRYGVPVILDIRDLWPDILYERITAKTGLPFKGYLIPYERMGKRAIRDAASVISLTQGMLAWAQARFDRTDGRDAVFHQSQTELHTPPDTEAWSRQGISFSADKSRFIWSGTMGADLDLGTLLDVLETLPPDNARALAISG